jgi:selenocysteine lyase/cysteine desulfurase
MFSMDECSELSSSRFDVEMIAEMCSRNNIYILLDLAHAIGVISLKLH